MSVLGVSYRSYRVWQRNRDVVFRLWFVELVPPILGPIIVITALGLGLGVFVELSGDQDYIEFLTPGLLALIWTLAALNWSPISR